MICTHSKYRALLDAREPLFMYENHSSSFDLLVNLNFKVKFQPVMTLVE